MLKAVDVLPAGPGEQEPDLFPLRERLRFRDNLGLGLRDVRQRPAFATLARGPWLAFIAIACYWQSNAEAWPSQETIASFSGYSSRAVRDYVEVLEALGVVRLRRERRPNGSERIYYAPGPVTLTELAAFVERFPNAPTRSAPSHPPETSSGGPPHPPEVASGAPPETSSMEPRDQDLELSSCVGGASVAMAVAEQEQPSVTQSDREIARIALAERMKRKHPKRPPPRWFDRADVEMVAVCVATIDGDRETKLQALRDSISGAFCSSKDGPPTSRFIWGRLEHFLEHLELGRRKAYAQQREAQRLAQESGREIFDGRDEVTLGNGPRNRQPSREELAKTRAEFEELAANAAPAFRKTLESLAARYRELELKAESNGHGSGGLAR
jgi:Helix-turn-helix domain